MSIIVTGATGFIGSQVVKDLLDLQYDVIGLDILPSKIQHNKYAHYLVDITTKHLQHINPQDVLCVCHFAGKIRVDESVRDPDMYYHHNVQGTLNLLKWCTRYNIKNIIFASTAAVYTSVHNPLKCKSFVETDPTDIHKIQSVYGKTKLINEHTLHDYAHAYGIKGYIFRFFNVCGGSEKNHTSPVHLIPIVVNNIINNKDINIYGTDYATEDGTCMRDYIHLKDISSGFIKAIHKGFSHNGFQTYNLGSNKGYTVKEIVNKTIEIYNTIKRVSTSIKVHHSPRRPGDIDVLLADTTKAKMELGWTAQYNLDSMIEDSINDFNA